MNFGGGEEDLEELGQGSNKPVKKSRKEVFEEIMEKSKSYDQARKEMRLINQNMVKELDAGLKDVLPKLNYARNHQEKVDAPNINTAL